MAKRSARLRGFSLTFRLSLGFTLLITFLMGLLGCSLYVRDRNTMIKQAIDQGWAVSHTANTAASSALKAKNYSLLEDMMKNLRDNDFILDAAIIDLEGNVVAASSIEDVGEGDETSGAFPKNSKNEAIIPIEDEKGNLIALAFNSVIVDDTAGELGYLNLMVDFTRIHEDLQQRAYQLVMSFVITALAGLILVRLIVIRYVGKPVGELLKATERVSIGDFSYILPVSSSDELGQLAHGFNVMSEQLGVLFNSIKSIVEDMKFTSSIISKRTETSVHQDLKEDTSDRQYEIIKEINVNAKRLTRMSQQLNSLALQFKTVEEGGTMLKD
jgi:methyl-accepting chemotaxis protein